MPAFTARRRIHQIRIMPAASRVNTANAPAAQTMLTQGNLGEGAIVGAMTIGIRVVGRATTAAGNFSGHIRDTVTFL